MDEAHKELVKRLQRIQVGMANEEEDAVLAAIAAIEALAGEVERLKTDYGLLCDTLRDDRAERDRLNEAIERNAQNCIGTINKMEAEAISLRETIETATKFNEGLATERDRLKAALGAIAVKAGTSECGGNYVAAVSLIGDLEQMADAALRAAGDGR